MGFIYRRPFLVILVGIALLLITGTSKSGLGRLVAFSSFMAILLAIYFLFARSDEWLDQLLPEQRFRNWIDKKTVVRLSTGCFLASLVLLLVELGRFENFLRPWNFWKTFTPWGILLAVVFIFGLPFLSFDLYDSSKRRHTIFWTLLIGLPLVVVVSANIINRTFAEETAYTRHFEVVEQRISNRSSSHEENYLLRLAFDEGQHKEIHVSKKVYARTKVGETVTMVLRDGLLGFEIIEEKPKGSQKNP